MNKNDKNFINDILFKFKFIKKHIFICEKKNLFPKKIIK